VSGIVPPTSSTRSAVTPRTAMDRPDHRQLDARPHGLRIPQPSGTPTRGDCPGVDLSMNLARRTRIRAVGRRPSKLKSSWNPYARSHPVRQRIQRLLADGERVIYLSDMYHDRSVATETHSSGGALRPGASEPGVLKAAANLYHNLLQTSDITATSLTWATTHHSDLAVPLCALGIRAERCRVTPTPIATKSALYEVSESRP